MKRSLLILMFLVTSMLSAQGSDISFSQALNVYLPRYIQDVEKAIVHKEKDTITHLFNHLVKSKLVGTHFDDFQSNSLKIPVMLADDKEHLQIEIDAYPTGEGYYQALIPAGTGQYTIAVMIGQICDWLQIEEVNFHHVEDFMEKKIDDDSITANPIYEGMTENAPGLRQCSQADAFMFVPPPAISTGEPIM